MQERLTELSDPEGGRYTVHAYKLHSSAPSPNKGEYFSSNAELIIFYPNNFVDFQLDRQVNLQLSWSGWATLSTLANQGIGDILF